MVEVAVAALPAAGEPLHDDVVRRLDQQRGREPPPDALELLGQRVGLLGGAGEAVEQEAVGAVLLDLVEDHADDQLVRDELALLHVRRGLAPELRLLLAVLAQEVARADVGQPEVVLQAGGLGALAGAGWTQQDEVELAQ